MFRFEVYSRAGEHVGSIDSPVQFWHPGDMFSADEEAIPRDGSSAA
jgi:hypothetical protein